MGKFIKGFHHVALKCGSTEQYEETIRFYNKVLDMELVRTWGEGIQAGAMLNTGSGMMELFAGGQVQDSTGSIHHIGLETDDVDGCIERVRDAGYKVTMEPTDIVITSEPPYPARVAFCIGPVGEEIEFFHVK